MNLLFTALIVVWAAWLILKKYKPQTVLFVAGGLLLAGSMIMSWGTILPAGKSTGMWSFDIFELIRTLFANRLSGLGLNIMAVGGFARYMDKIGASNALVALTIRRRSMPFFRSFLSLSSSSSLRSASPASR